MFRRNPDGMRMEATPERVLSVCRLVAHKSMTRDEVCRAMTLNQNEEKELDQIRKSIAVASEELCILRMKNDKLELAVKPDMLASPDTFRRYVSSVAFAGRDTTFFMFTKWIIEQNEKIFALRTWEGMAKTCGTEISELSAINENAVLGWRFWAAFLGVGYLSGAMIIPNMKQRLQDIMVTEFPKRFNYGERVRATDFIAWLDNRMSEVNMEDKLPLALSAGLRTLHELGFIRLETWRDSNRGMLYKVDGELINDFSHITVKEVITR